MNDEQIKYMVDRFHVDEFTFRLNNGKVERHIFDRLDSLVDNVVGKRITYQNLTAERN